MHAMFGGWRDLQAVIVSQVYLNVQLIVLSILNQVCSQNGLRGLVWCLAWWSGLGEPCTCSLILHESKLQDMVL